MADNFHKAANRHFDAADLLYREARTIEASHLYAYAAECALKAIARGQGKPLGNGHINDHILKPTGTDLIGLYQARQRGHQGCPLPTRKAWFEGWTVNERYGDGASVEPHLAKHKTDADVVRAVFKRARDQGVLP